MIPKEGLFSKVWALEPYLVPAVVVLVGVGAFGMGRLSATSGQPVSLRIIYPDAQAATPIVATQVAGEGARASQVAGQFVASKNGSKYYLTTCSGANRIKQENKVYFVSQEGARAAGYEPAANCPGL